MKKFVVLMPLNFFLLLSNVNFASAQSYPPGQWNRIIDNQDFISTPLVLEGESGSNTLIINSRFHGSSDYTNPQITSYDAITLRNVHNVYFLNNQIYNIPGHGIVLRSTGSTDKVTIDNNIIYNIRSTGILPKRNYDNPGVDHTNLVIKNNVVYNVGSGGLDHGMYIMAKDSLISNNIIHGSTGNGISIRSSGIIRGNYIWDTNKSCIRYFSDHETGTSKTLIIENNVCHDANEVDYPLVSLLYSAGSNLSWLPDNYFIRFNTLVSTSIRNPGIQVQSSEFDPKQVNVNGNIVINTQNQANTILPNYIDYISKNYISNQVSGFASNTPNYDFHLTQTSPAINYATGESSFPLIDKDNLARTTTNLDAGAYQLIRVTIPGDLNYDGQVTINDYNLVVNHFGNPYTIYDYNNVASNFGL